MPNRQIVLSGLFTLQALAAIFFLWDGLGDLFGTHSEATIRLGDRFEYLIAAALLLSTGYTFQELMKTMRRNRVLTDQIRVVSGEFATILEEWFDRWGLTPSERDVALLTIKGLSNNEIAAIRNTREGTIKAQCNAIYRKAGVTGRPQLLSLFVEELMGGLPRAEPVEGEQKGRPEDRPFPD